MSLDRSLRTGASLARHRNVLTRAERVARLVEKGKFDLASSNPVGMPKVGNRKVATAGKSAKKDDAAATPAAAGAAAAKPAAGAKPAAAGAKPAAGGKAAPAPAAKAAAPAAKKK